uniref:Probable protein S-acyltransferase 7 n=1 Tax=Tanacetum cinerariifolium TaxID=118510 RepID=A0A699IK38_TANCI|nr:probable protein S-acyltransferase 7 [Tanacetum cinerariifolium]
MPRSENKKWKSSRLRNTNHICNTNDIMLLRPKRNSSHLNRRRCCFQKLVIQLTFNPTPGGSRRLYFLNRLDFHFTFSLLGMLLIDCPIFLPKLVLRFTYFIPPSMTLFTRGSLFFTYSIPPSMTSFTRENKLRKKDRTINQKHAKKREREVEVESVKEVQSSRTTGSGVEIKLNNKLLKATPSPIQMADILLGSQQRDVIGVADINIGPDARSLYLTIGLIVVPVILFFSLVSQSHVNLFPDNTGRLSVAFPTVFTFYVESCQQNHIGEM